MSKPARTFKPVNAVAAAKAQRKKLQAFFTPEPLVLKLVEWAGVLPSMRVLEPSSGDGRIVHALLEWGVEAVDACELEPAMYEASRAAGANMVGTDFLKYRPEGRYDAIVMNPPFNGKTWVKHLEHAYSMLAEYGQIHCLAPGNAHESFGDGKVKLPGCCNATCEELGGDYFAEFDTKVSVALVEVFSPPRGGEQQHLGFANLATWNAYITLATDREWSQRCASARSGNEICRDYRSTLARIGVSVHGVDWAEVHAELTRPDETPTCDPTPVEQAADEAAAIEPPAFSPSLFAQLEVA